MISRLLPASRRPYEFLFLLGLAFFLPLYEAPKNILWLAYVVAWLWNRWRDRDWGGAWGGWDSLILAWIASGFVVAFFAGVHHSEWRGAADILRYGSILWCLRRSGYTRRELSWLAGMLLASCAVTLAWGFWRYYITHERPFVELNSVGHVNHSAPYIAICAALAMSWLLTCWQAWSGGRRAVMLSVLAFLMGGLLIGASRGAIGAIILVPFVLGMGWWRRSRKPLAILAIAVAAVIAAAIAGNASVVSKQRTGMDVDPLSGRGTIWRRALVGWEAYPWFGVGIDNFGRITDELVRQTVEAKGETYRREDYVGPNHAHSLYLNTLAERGLVGFTVFIAVLLAWGGTMWRHRPRPDAGDTEWMLWGAGISAWTVLSFAGVFNTTLHHEIALLAMLLFGAWQSQALLSPARTPGPATN